MVVSDVAVHHVVMSHVAVRNMTHISMNALPETATSMLMLINLVASTTVLMIGCGKSASDGLPGLFLLEGDRDCTNRGAEPWCLRHPPPSRDPRSGDALCGGLHRRPTWKAGYGRSRHDRRCRCGRHPRRSPPCSV